MADTLGEDEWFERLKAAAQAGELVDLVPDDAQFTFADPVHASVWPTERTIPANAIRRILTLPEAEMKTLDPRGLRVRGARIVGDAKWNRVNFPRLLAFDRCAFLAPIKLSDARLLTLGLQRCALLDVQLDAAQINGGVSVDNATVTGVISAVGANISGQFNLIDANLDNPDGPTLILDSAQISLGVYAANLTANGEIRAAGARIGGQLNLDSATLTSPNGHALQLDGASVEGTFFGRKLRTYGEARAAGIRISGELNLSGATFANLRGRALNLELAHIGLDLLLSESEGTRARALGEVRGVGIRVNGKVDIGGAILGNIGGPALTLESARIGDHLDLDRATITNSKGQAVILDGARLDSDLSAASLIVDGETRAIGARINGQLNLTNATLTRPWDEDDSDDEAPKPALNLDWSRVDGGLFGNGLTAKGEVRAIGAHITGRTDLTDASLINYFGDALTMEAAELDDLILLPTRISGNVHLDLAKIATLHLPSKADTGRGTRAKAFSGSTLSAAGWSVTDLRGAARSDWEVARNYLGRTPSLSPTPAATSDANELTFIPHPWYEIADVYDRIGHPDDSKELRLYTEKQITKKTRGRTKAIRWAYDLTVGYGYRPGRPVLWLLGVLVAAGLLIWTNQAHFLNINRLAATANDSCSVDSDYACFNTIGYTLQNVVPAASGPLRPDWVLATNGWWPITVGFVLAVLRLFAWGFAALTLAAMTGLLRKR